MSLLSSDFIKLKPALGYADISSDDILQVVVSTNNYIKEIDNLSRDYDFNFFESLGSRNISGIIGEIFANFFSIHLKNFVKNPHPDGRPDILDLSNKQIHDYYMNECFTTINNKKVPIKSKLTPFQFGGIEVKCTIGKKPSNSGGNKEFGFGKPRIDSINGIMWQAHHVYSNTLLGLYFDYYEISGGLPQIMAVFYAELNEANWRKVVTGSSSSKSTSVTSLTSDGLNKMRNNCIVSINNSKFISKFISLGIPIAL
jgi:hypothetical protein